MAIRLPSALIAAWLPNMSRSLVPYMVAPRCTQSPLPLLSVASQSQTCANPDPTVFSPPRPEEAA